MATNGLNLQTSGLTFTTGQEVRGIITNLGRYGVGTLLPEAALHVVPTGSTTSVRFEGLGSSSTETNYLVADSNGVLETRNDVVTLAGTQTLTNKTINGSQLVDGSVANAKLTNDDVTIGSTSIALGATSTTLAGLTSVTSTTFVGDLTGTADDATALATARDFSITGDITASAISFDGTGNVALNASIDAGVVDTTELANGAVTSDKLATNAVTTIKITDGNVTNAKLANDDLTVTAGNGLTDGGLVALGSSTTLNVGAGTGIVVNANDVALDYAGTDNFIDSATDLEGTTISDADTIIYHDATDDNVKKGLVSDLPFSNNSGTVTSVAISGTDGIDVDSGSPITTSGTITLGLSNVPNSSLQNSSVTIGSTSIALGATSLTLAGLTSVTSTTFVGDLTGTADDATALATARDFSITGDITASAISFDGTGNVALNATIDAGVVDTAELANGAVTSDKLATNAVTTIKITDGNVTNAKLANSSITLAGDSGSSQTVSLGDTLTVAGGTGLSSVASATDTVTINLDNTAVGAGSYGSSSAVGTFTVDAQGRLTAASNVTIDGSAINNNNAFTTINVPTGNDPVANAYNDTLNFTSADGTLTISGNSTTDTIDFSVNLASVDSFVTGATLSSGTLTLTLNNGQSDVTASGFNFTIAGDSGSSTRNLGQTVTVAGGTYTNTTESSGTVTVDLDTAATLFTVTADSGSNQAITPGNTLDIAGGTGLSTVVGSTDTVTINLDDTAVTPSSYGSASETVTFTVDAQGRLTAASEQTISITSSEVSDFSTASENVIFQSANFTNTVGAGGINFAVVAGDSVSAVLVNDSLTVTAGNGLTDGGSVDLGSSVTLNVGAGTGIVVNSNDIALDYAGTDNFIDSATNLEGTAIATSDTIIYHDATDDNVKKGLVSDLPFSNNSGTVTSVAIAGTDGIDVDSGSPITTSGTITLGLSNVPNSSLQNSSVTVTAGDGLTNGGSVSLGGSVTVNVAAGDGIVVNANDVAHYNAGGGASDVDSNNSNGTVIQDVTLDFDTFGHVTGATVGTTNLDNRYYSFRTIDVPSGTNPVADAYNDTLNFISSDSSVVISGNSTSDTIDITVAGSVDTNIYNTDGTLSGTRTVTQAGNSLEFTGGDFKVDGTTFNVIDGTNSVAIGSNTADASAVLEVASTTKGFLFPRMTEAQRIAIAAPATGLMVYQTNGAEGVYIYKSFGWVQVI